MANYNSLKNAGLLAPVANADLGSPTNTYGNLYMSGNVSLNGTLLNSTNAITPRIATIAYVGNDTATAPAGGATITLTGSGFVSGAAVYVGGTIATPVTVVSSSQLTFVAPAKTAGSYSLNVVNIDGAAATFIPGMQYSGVPAWSTSAGSLGTVNQSASVSYTVAATSDSTVTYSVTSGSLPSGVSLNTSTGTITGTAPSVGSNTTYSFTIRATDSENQDTDRNFSMTVNAVSPPSAVEYLVIAGGGGAAGAGTNGGAGGGGGAGVYKTATGLSVSAGSPITVTVGAGGTGAYNSGYTEGNDSVFNGITSYRGGRGGGALGMTGGFGGSGGGGMGYNGGGSNFGAQGNAGGSGSYSNGENGGGGGGAGGGGASASGLGAGNGGAGLQSSITGTATYYAGGGGGGQPNAGKPAGTGGQGGGGAGNHVANVNAWSGEANTGGGGGGAYAGSGGSGGSGIVVIRYPDSNTAASATTGSPTITVAGGYRVYKFTSSGSITF